MRSAPRFPWIALVLGVSFVLLGAWTADAIKGATPFLDWFSPDARNPPVQIKIGMAIFLLALLFGNVVGLYRLRKAWLPIRVLKEKAESSPRKVLVMGLSQPDEGVKGFDFGDGSSLVLYDNASGSLIPVHSLANAMAGMGRHRWQQSLRTVDFHAKTKLELLIVIPSNGRFGSGQFTNQFKDWITRYQSSGDWKPFQIEIVAAVDYEGVADLQSAYTAAIRLAETKDFKEADVVIDVTAGQKTTSIAAALVTFTSEADFQYVQTGGTNKTLTYSVTSEDRRDQGG